VKPRLNQVVGALLLAFLVLAFLLWRYWNYFR
jgi:hypothetical protein